MPRKKLREYQKRCFAYARKEKHPALFMEMRLGKTLVAIRRAVLYPPMDPRRGLKCLVVAPNSALGSWEDELISEKQTFTYLKGTAKKRMETLKTSTTTWFLFNKEGHLALPEVAQYPWDVIILDESTFIKNPNAQVTKFFTGNFKNVPHKFVLTGTPNPEGDLDYVCQFMFLDNRFMGCSSFWEFRKKYYKPGPPHAPYDWTPKPGVSDAIAKYVAERSFVLRRKDVGLDKRKIRQIRYLDFDNETKKAYKKLECDWEVEYNGKDFSTIWNGAVYSALRQMCGGFFMDKLSWNGKLNELVSLLTGELKHEQVVVWFAHNNEIKAAIKALGKERVAVIKGDISVARREEYRKQFQKGDIRILLVQLMCAEEGMNLSAADTAIYFSEPLGFKARKQTEDRILDVDQKGPLLFIYLLVRNSVDIDIHALQRVKGLENDISISKVLEQSLKKRLGHATKTNSNVSTKISKKKKEVHI